MNTQIFSALQKAISVLYHFLMCGKNYIESAAAMGEYESWLVPDGGDVGALSGDCADADGAIMQIT